MPAVSNSKLKLLYLMKIFLEETDETSALSAAQLLQRLEGYGFGRIAEGTVYPLLLRLERNGLIRADYRSSELGPRRKYYALTQTGRAALGDFLTHYRALERAVSRLIEETEKLEVQADE